MKTREAVIVDAVRTPVGKRNGALSTVHPVDLSAHVLCSLARRTGIDPAVVDQVLWGCVAQVGEQSANVARAAVLAAGWPEQVPGTTVDRQCGSSQQAVQLAAALVVSGQADVVVAGGAESMSRIPLGTAERGPGLPLGPRVAARYGQDWFEQGDSAEIVARRYGVSRERADDIALESHARAAAATDGGRFASQLAPLVADGARVAADEGIRRGGTRETMAALRPAFAEDGVMTAGNSSQISDGAAALLVTTPEGAAALGLRPLVRIRAAVSTAVDPVTMLTGPVPATRKALDRAGLKTADVGAFEINEAFASVIAAWQDETGVRDTRLNPLGGAIALGHPLGGSGARLMTTLVHHMAGTGTSIGLQSMCERGGTASAVVLELAG
ncbi:acetyl-CoA acetyltransferase [Streptomyces sp. MNU77]|uniref:thiolase family protein n=1 Tax=Streptomyces sp. MNU77 TaxID=1573406 RepID=UPI0005E4CFA4|nr:thiolase family protein [Streptomyces sp. MNU77]OLO25780.1 acetyl-CoA acetyltransferase [Streptomyces sp. MNU77]